MPDKKTKPNDLKYIGGGYVIGVPARDLTAAEFADLSLELQAQVLASGFYEIVRKEE